MSKIVETFTDKKTPGYFSIGQIALQLSVDQIAISRVQNDDEIMTLRAKFPMIVKTGHSRIDVTVTWKALLGISGTGAIDYSQYEDVRSVVAMFKSAPFVQVENEHIRNFLSTEDNFKDRSTAMAFALKNMVIQSNADIVDALDITLTMTLFNYLPYSVDFAYQTSYGTRCSVLDSDVYTSYIQSWKTNNLDKHPIEFSTKNWKSQGDSSTNLYYRSYKTINPPQPTPQWPNVPAVPNDSPTFYKDSGYVYDHFTDETGFIYRINSVQFGKDEFLSSDTFITGVAVEFTNNFAQIPLSNYQYPTYQHVGPSVTNISLSFQASNPDSSILSDINSMLNTLDSQYISFRTKARKISSIYAMQAVFVQNQILNMLGIYAIQPKNLQSMTLDDSVMYQGQLIGIHYENTIEDLSGFKVTSPLESFNQSVQVLSDPAILSGSISPGDNLVIKPLTDFYTAKQNHDYTYFTANGFNTTQSGGSLIESMPSIPLGTNALSSDNLTALKVIGSNLANSGTYTPTLKSDTSAAGTLSYTDCIVIFALADKNGTVTIPILAQYATAYNNAKSQISSWANTQTTYPMDQMFDQLFSSLVQQNPSFSKAVQAATASPQYKKATQNSGPISPGTDPYNAGHGAYSDLGLTNITVNGEDFNPAIYYYNYNNQLYNKLRDQMTSKITDILNPTLQLNNQISPATQVLTPTDPTLLAYNPTTGIGQGNPYGLMLRTNVPGTNMAEAFPTFKLFLYEEDNNSVFFAFDSFYTYASVSDIEIIRYQDKPDLAKLVLTNLSGLLTHRLFDNSADGKREWELEAGPVSPLSADGSAVTDPSGQSKVGAFKDPQGMNYMRGMGGKKVPNKYYALQTGSKIQIRMGYSNNPDKLWPVFTGQITEVLQKGEIMVVEAQSFMLELMQATDEKLKSDGWSLPGVLADTVLATSTVGPEFASQLFSHPLNAPGALISGIWNIVNPFKKTKAYSGSAVFGVSGDADNVIKDLIKCSSARHFGRWQIESQGDPFVKGFSWKQINPLPAGTVPSNLIASLYDRSGENVLINGYINVDGSSILGTPDTTHRPWDIEHVLGMPAQYSIPKELINRPTWDFIKDISRRYPEYVLAVKQYGFPYGADATLIYAHPNDWYRARPVVIGETNQQAPNDQRDGSAFYTWWLSTGKAAFASKIIPIAKAYNVYNDPDAQRDKILSLAQITPVLGLPNNLSAPIDPAAISSKIDNTQSYSIFVNYLQRVQDTVASSQQISGFLRATSLAPGLQNIEPLRALTDITQLLREAQVAVNAFNSNTSLQSTSDTSIQPVRRYHFIDSHSIIHNGMDINDKIYNAVKVGDDIYKSNGFIPSHHVRLLDCNPIIVNPDENVKPAIMTAIRKSVAASFMREELGKMYSGEILLRGIPSIEPYDVLLIQDPTTGIVGPIEVDSVVHSFNQETGSITIVRPKTLTLVNEVFTLGTLASLIVAGSEVSAVVRNLGPQWDATYKSVKDIVTSTTGKPVPETNIGTSLFGWVGPIATAGILGLGLVSMFSNNTELVPILVCPVRKINDPWIGGLEGYRIGDSIQHLGDIIKQFAIDNIAPLIESYRTAQSFLAPAISGVAPAQASPAARGTNNVSSPITGDSSIDKIAEAIRKVEGGANINKARSTRNNNPGNLEENGDVGRDGPFAVFSTWDKGVAALKRDLRAKFREHPNYTITQLMTIYLGGNPANPMVTSQGNPFTYAQQVATGLGVPVTTQLKNLPA